MAKASVERNWVAGVMVAVAGVSLMLAGVLCFLWRSEIGIVIWFAAMTGGYFAGTAVSMLSIEDSYWDGSAKKESDEPGST